MSERLTNAPAPGASEFYGLSGLVRGEDTALPWLLPGIAVSAAVSVLVGGVAARALDTRRAVATLLVFSLGVIVSATLTPLGGDLVLDGGVPGTCDLSRLWFAPLGVFRGLNDTSLNVLLFVPLGVAIALLPRTRRIAVVAIGALFVPLVIETTQLVVQAISRGCESADVIDNLLGLGIGFAGGLVLRGLATYVGRSVNGPEERPGLRRPLRPYGSVRALPRSLAS